MAAWVVALCMQGVPMLYNGQEIGCPVQLQYFNASTPIDWTTSPDGVMEGQYRRLLALFNGSATLRGGTLTSYSSDDVCAFTRATADSSAFVLVNMRGTPVTYTLPPGLPAAGWTDALTGGVVPPASQVSLGAYQYAVWNR
jgi:glycosidase